MSSPPVAEPAAHLRRVLVVDDEVLVAMAVADQCRDLGLEVQEAYGPDEALRAFAAGETPDAIVTDVRMPGMSGPDLVRAALARRADLAVVYMTGFAAEAGRFAGAWPVLSKPFDLEDLAPALDRAARLRGTAP